MNSELEARRSESGTEDIFPPEYAPALAPASVLTRCGWRLTRLGRARLALRSAIAEPDSADARARLDLARAQYAQPSQNAKEAELDFLREALLFSTWSAVRREAWQEAEEYLATLRAHFADSSERLALRAALVDQIYRRRDSSAYTKQVGSLLTSALAPRFMGLVLREVVRVYELLSIAERKALIAWINPALLQDARVQAAVALWQCPLRFTSQSEARPWAGQIPPEAVSFAPRMCADALLVQAHLAEWENDRETMEQHAGRAMEVLPGYAPALICFTRTQLFVPGARLPHEGELGRLPQSPELDFLRSLCRLHLEPTLESAARVETALGGGLPWAGPLDLRLALRLLEQVLSSDPMRERNNLQQCAALSQRLERGGLGLIPQLAFYRNACGSCGKTVEFPREMAGTEFACAECGSKCELTAPRTAMGLMPWAEASQALFEIHETKQYQAAFERLESGEVVPYPESRRLALVARLLAGLPARGAKSSTDANVLLTLGEITNLLLGKPCGQGESLQALGAKLESSRGDTVFKEFPPLLGIADILQLATRVLGGDSSSAEAVTQHRPAPDVPAWCVSLFGRLWQVTCDFSQAEVLMAGSPANTLVEAWSVLAWWHYFAPAGLAAPSGLDRLRQIVEAGLPADHYAALDAMRRGRSDVELSGKMTRISSRMLQGFACLGALAAAVCERELALESEICALRNQINGGQADSVAVTLTQWLDELGEMGMLVAAWWRPVIEYWLGVALARSGSPRAAGVLAGLVLGRKASEARAQLAILAVEQNDLVTADRWLDDLQVSFPAASYARALVLARKGEAIAAVEGLRAFGETLDESSSTYDVAARRLAAAIEERKGNHPQAAGQNQAILRARPGDPVASARLGRILLRQGWPTMGSDGLGQLESVRTILGYSTTGAPAALERFKEFNRLVHWLTCPDAELEALMTGQGKRKAGLEAHWRQILVWRFVNAGQPARALEIMGDGKDTPEAAWQRCARFNLAAWSLLSSLWSPCRAPKQHEIAAEAERIYRDNGRVPGRDEQNWAEAERRLREKAAANSADTEIFESLQGHLQAMNAFAEGAGRPGFERWKRLVDLAVTLGRPVPLPGTLETWKTLSPWPVATAPQLWLAGTRNERKASGEAVAKAVKGDGAGYTVEQVSLLNALAHWATGAEDAFLEAYTRLEPVLDSLPVNPRNLWQAAASIRYRRRQWNILLKSDLPDCVADLSDPGVRLIMGLAYASAAADDVGRNDSRAALQKLRQAQDNLTLVCQRGPEFSDTKGK